jgi:leucyl aminopeptidase
MPSVFETAPNESAIPISFVTRANWEAISRELSPEARRFADANGFAAGPGKCLTLPASDGGIAQVLFGLEEAASKALDPFRPGALPGLLPAGLYRFANAPHDARLAALAFALGSYRFARYRKSEKARSPAGAAGWRRYGRHPAHGGSGQSRPRSHQHAGQ